MLELSDVGLCLDTGHLLIGDGDPVTAIADWGERINHFHLKDARIEVLEQIVAQGAPADSIWRRRAFCGLGDGDVDVTRTLRALQARGYSGWLVVEQDIMPTPPTRPGGPPASRPPTATTCARWVCRGDRGRQDPVDGPTGTTAAQLGRRRDRRRRRDRHQRRLSPRRGRCRCRAGRARRARRRLDLPRRGRRPDPVLRSDQHRDSAPQHGRISRLRAPAGMGDRPPGGWLPVRAQPRAGRRRVRRSVELQRSLGVDSELLSAAQARELCPLLAGDDILAASFSPRDGHATPEGVVPATPTAPARSAPFCGRTARHVRSTWWATGSRES